MISYYIVGLFILFAAKNAASTDTASFFGASYIKCPLEDSKSTTDISFRFRTKRSDSMLFVAAGKIDYCYLRIEAGRLKVRINLGGGEAEVDSPRGLRLDDLAWHDVLLTRKEADVTLTIDRIHTVKEKLPGRFFELNIHYGVYLGGMGDLTMFLGHTDWLRGCLADVKFNNNSLLQKARQRSSGQKIEVQGITWNCASEFDASVDQEISFVEDGAFLALPNAITRTGARLEMQIKTSAAQGLLVYNSGVGNRPDFVGLELQDGRPRLLLDKGDGRAELVADTRIDDGHWHTIVAQFHPTAMEVTVDGHTVNNRLDSGSNQYFDLSEVMYLGGTELNKRAKALGQSLRSADASLRGCVRAVELDDRSVGLPDARVSHGVHAGCLWDFMCIKQPCVPGARCEQQGLSSFQCHCDSALPPPRTPPQSCVKPDYVDTYKVYSRGAHLQLVELSPLSVTEGDNALVTTSNINVVLDYTKYGVRDSGVLMRVIDPPTHGKLAVEVWERRGASGDSGARKHFTLLDLTRDKVRYLHDGSESTSDVVVMELELVAGPDFVQPAYLQEPHRFALQVNITPVNDPPALTIPPGRVLRLAQGTRKVLTTDYLHAEDPDTPADALVYTQLNADSKKGSIELTTSLGSPVTSFTQQDIDSGRVIYVHNGPSERESTNAKLAFQVSDGIETSPVAVLRVTAFPLQLRLVNNTGIVLTHRASAPILPANLTFLTNADDSEVEVQYEVVKPPQFGSLERVRALPGSGSATAAAHNVDRFNSSHLAREEIRYVHATGNPAHDDFKFKVTAGNVKSPTTYDFRITFTKLRLEQSRREELVLEHAREAILSEKHLLYRTEPLATDAHRLIYHLVQAPRHGNLALVNSRLSPGDTFSQQDLREGLVSYRLLRHAYSRIRDEFTFRVSAPDCEAIPGSLSVVHETGSVPVPGLSVTLERLQVAEGGSARLTAAALRLAKKGVDSLRYSVTTGPQHGWLRVGGPNPNPRDNATEFTSEELASGLVDYTHDDSESQHDAFNFVALSSEADDFMYAGTFHVDVVLKNDNAPVRAVSRVFRVVTGGERLLTGRHLRYTDADADTSSDRVLYKRQEIPNGGLYRASQPGVSVMEFSQEDLNEGRLLFRHHGPEHGKMAIWVTDGQFEANGVLEIRASPPYVELTNNSRLLVRHGGAAPFSITNLCADSNVNSLPEQLKFEVLEGPNHGRLFLRDIAPAGKTGKAAQDRQAVHFTQKDLEEGRLWYQHDASATLSDAFRFRVDVPGTTAEGRFEVRVFPSSYWEPFVVVANDTITVEEATSVAISNKYLEVKQSQVPSNDITFMVVQPPKYGYLEIEPSPESEDPRPSGQTSVLMFEQSLVNDARVLYVQTAANQTQDRVVLDVTNGISWLRGLVITFLVIPDSLYLGGGEVRVSEGGTVTIPLNAVPVLTDYYRARISEFRVTSPPSSGRIQHAREPGQILTKFSPQQLQAGIVQYTHDGSENSEDAFFLTAHAGEKSSGPARVRVIVTPINDEKPRVANSSRIKLWKGSAATITPHNLAVTDLDTPPQNITFRLLSVDEGHVALANQPGSPVSKFSQLDVNNNAVVFVHSGTSEKGRVELVASDGVRDTEHIVLEVIAEQTILRLVANTGLHVFPMLRKCLTPEELLATCSDPSCNVTFTVRMPTSQGRLLLTPGKNGEPGGELGRDVFNFSQRHVNQSRVCYQHASPFKNIQANDSFHFQASSPFAEALVDQVFNIEVSVSSGGLDQFVSVSPLIVEEGGSEALVVNTSTVLEFLKSNVGLENPVVQVVVTQPPVHGAICVRAECNSPVPFTAAQLASGDVLYRHDHSDTIRDQLAISLLLAPGDVLLCNVSIPITVNPVNDQPFRLAVPLPQLTVVQGQAASVTRKQLLTEDADTSPDELVYDVINVPTQGRLVLSNNFPEDAVNEGDGFHQSVGHFSQADIDAGRLWYVHAGPLQADSFHFRVSDKKFTPIYKVFNIQVQPLMLNVSVRIDLRLQQGSNVAPLSGDLFLVQTNGRRDTVHYNVTRPPRHGGLYVLRNRPVVSFSQADLEAGRVLYMQSDMTVSSDSLEVVAWQPAGSAKPVTSSSPLTLNVTVTPLLRFGAFSPIVGAKTPLDLGALDASQLSQMTGSDPVYRVLRRPRLGKIRKFIRNSGERNATGLSVREREIDYFTHREIQAGLIYYVSKRQLGGKPGDEDSLEFELAASIFQPAIGELRFLLRSEHGPPPTSFVPQRPRMPGPKSPFGDQVVVASPNMSNDYFFIVTFMAGVIILALLVVVVVKCRAGAVQGMRDGPNGKADIADRAPLPLPRPPDDLMPASPRPKHFGAPSLSLASTPTPSSFPQCKVIPLGPSDSITSSEADLNVNIRYPYGVDDTPQEWSSFETTTGQSDMSFMPRGTMLRRNQYWV